MMLASSCEKAPLTPPMDPRHATRHILVVEDERDIAELIALHLGDLPAAVTLAQDGPTGLQLALSRAWDAIVLDIRLPGLNGLDLCRELRSQLSPVPILMLTARGGELDRVLGLELGADAMTTQDWVGTAAATLTTIAFMPQAWLTWKTRRADGVSLGMYSIFTVGVALWLTYGVMLDAWPIVVANAITLVLAAFILLMKLRGK